MAATSYREKRRTRKADGNGLGYRYTPAHSHLPHLPRLVLVGTVGGLLPLASSSPSLSVLVAGRYEVRVGSGFDAPTLTQLVRTLEQLA